MGSGEEDKQEGATSVVIENSDLLMSLSLTTTSSWALFEVLKSLYEVYEGDNEF